MHQAYRTLTNVGCVQGADEELIVRTVDGVAALEGKNILARRQCGADLRRGGTGEDALRQRQPLDLATCAASGTLSLLLSTLLLSILFVEHMSV